MAEIKSVSIGKLPRARKSFDPNGEHHHLVLGMEIPLELAELFAAWAFEPEARVDVFVGKHDLTSWIAHVRLERHGLIGFVVPDPETFIRGDVVKIFSLVIIDGDIYYLAFHPKELDGLLASKLRPEER